MVGGNQSLDQFIAEILLLKRNRISGIITIKLAINSFCASFLFYWLIIEDRIVKEYK